MSQNRTLQLITNDVDIHSYPKIEERLALQKGDELTIGDLHGNALKLTYFLIRHQILDVDEKNYRDLVKIYDKKPDDLTAKDLEKFNAILENSRVNPGMGTIRLIGDVLADRGSNDYFTLEILGKLQDTFKKSGEDKAPI